MIIDSTTSDADDFGDDAATTPRHCGETLSYYPSKLDLPALARRMMRAESLLEAFDSHLRSAKRASLRQFAYGLSHEINNPLANISTRAQTLMRGEPEAGRQQSLQRIVDQAMRAHEMTADLMFYAHPPEPKRSRFDLRGLVDAAVKLCADTVADRAIHLTTVGADAPVMVEADRAMMTEALRSLLRNSAEAIGCDGQVMVGCRVDPDTHCAEVTICDSGPGLSPLAAEHAFDPYFSGREAGRGLGVGLCRVETIAKIHGGGVELSSGTIGCTARVWIPVAT
jgi:signal transduction histidine kinase